MYEHLPAVVLPNIDNQQDAIVVLSNGVELSLSEFLRSLSSVQHLRFMIQGSDPRKAQNPRITWQSQPDNRRIIAAAFAVDTDSHNRVVSASVIYNIDDSESFQRKLTARLESKSVKELKIFFEVHLEEIRVEIDSQISLGMAGGEYNSKKKFAHRSGRHFDGLP